MIPKPQIPGELRKETLHGLEELEVELPDPDSVHGVDDDDDMWWNQKFAKNLSVMLVVVLLFLQGWRPAIIPLIAVPVAIIGTFAA
ncbi:MAG: hypothetical protein RL257_420, partial [Actinomycetota bacterium]